MSADLSAVNQITQWRIAWLLGMFQNTPKNRNHGGFIFENNYADSRNSIYEMQHLFVGYLYPDFPEYHHQPEMLERLRAAAGFMRRRQLPDGSILLGASGAMGGNEVGFTLPGVCATYTRLAKSDAPGKDSLLADLRDYILAGAACVRRYWPYTSNHRWTACVAPLSCAQHLFPDPENLRVIDEYLSDGIDIDAQGLYYEERSPNYDEVTNVGLLEMADQLGRKDMLDLVGRNLDFTLAMRQPTGEAETLFSHRQDRGGAGRTGGSYYTFKRMAVELNRGDFATAADQHLQRLLALADPAQPGGSFSKPGESAWHRSAPPFYPLRYLLDDPRLQKESIPREPLPETVSLRCTAAPIQRWRDGNRAATVVADAGGHFWDATYGGWGAPARSDLFFDFHVGGAIVAGVKIRWGNGTGGFRPAAIEDLKDGSLRLSYRDPGSEHFAHYRPEGKRTRRTIPADQEAEVTIQRLERGYQLHVRIGGTAEMPVNFQLLLRETNQLRAKDSVPKPLPGGGVTFTDGSTYELVGPDGACIRLAGLPASEHALALGDGGVAGLAEKQAHRLIAGVFTPVEFSLVLEEKS